MSDKSLHAEFPPSALARFEKCPGSWKLCKDIPSRETEFSKHGTECHAHVAEAIIAMLPGETLTEEVQKAYDFFKRIHRDDDRDVETEVRVAYKTFSGELYFGTADLVITRQNGDVVIVDWKFGRNPVAAPGNLQLAAYACAIAQERKPGKVTAMIFQPNLSEEPAVWEDIDTKEEIARIMEVIGMCRQDAAPLCPGDHCQYCDAWLDASCPAIRACAVAMGQAVIRKSCPLDIDALPTATEERLQAWMDAAGPVKRFLEALDDEVKRRCRENGSCAGYKLRKARGRLSITNPNGLFYDVANLDSSMTADRFLTAGSFSATKISAMLKKDAPDKDTAKAWAAECDALCEKHGQRGSETESLVRE